MISHGWVRVKTLFLNNNREEQFYNGSACHRVEFQVLLAGTNYVLCLFLMF